MYHVLICVSCLSFFASHAVTVQPPRKPGCFLYALPLVSCGLPWDPPEPSLLLCEQAQLSQPSLMHHIHLGDPPLHSLRYINLFPVPVGLKLDTVFQMQSHKW